MQAPITPHTETDEGTEFVTEADWIPDFWNFLLGLDRNDLIAELVQNDLDQQATRTVISFEQDHLVCEGNGKPVDAGGWQRLRKIRGAGDNVPAKRGKIGVKNHGLKTAFTISDEIRVLSDGQAITQTLYTRGQNNLPYPGASAEPRPDPEAPINGCRVVISYRAKDLEPREGEAIVLGAVRTNDIDALFKFACTNIPEQFAGIVSPEVAPRYEIVLRHWRLGNARFVFSCTRPHKVAKNIETFRRRCEVSGSADSLPAGLQEEAARRLVPLRGRLKVRLPDFFRRKNRFFVEVSWAVDGRGKPRKGIGRFRYPIGYPQSSHEARTGHGSFFNAPIVSDTERHGPARNEATNNELRQACETLLVDVIARRVVPKWGPEALNPLVPSPGSDNWDEAVRPLLATLAQRDAIPTMSWRSAVRILRKGRKLKGRRASGKALGQKNRREPRKYRFIAPVATWDRASVHSSLAAICPPQEKQLDPRINPGIIRLLADGHTDGFCDLFVTFDENDARNRATGEGNEYFAASEDRERDFAQPVVARSYLNVIKDALDKGKWKSESEEDTQSGLLLPDTRPEAVPFEDLHTSAPLPSDIPGLRLPPILHHEVASHPLFRRKKWRRPKYTMAKFLESGALQEADEETRKLFWKWLRQNERRIGPRERAKLADIAIWPDAKGSLRKLMELCEPRSRSVATVLEESIRRPHEQVRQSGITALGRKRRTSIRRGPTQDELKDWFDSRMPKFAIGEMADADIAAALERFEADLAVLLKDQGTARVLKGMEIALLALAQDGSIRRRIELVLPNKNIERLTLPKRFLLMNDRRVAVLNNLSPILSEPTMAMLVSAFQEDNTNFGPLPTRLQQFLTLTEPGDPSRHRVAEMAILPVHGQPHAPCDLAFMGPKGDYWGAWKVRIPGKGLSQDDQRRYLDIGVTPATPTSKASQAFFEWLSEQNADVLKRHISCALRHILHRYGPEAWAEIYTDIPFIPVRSRDRLRVVSLRTARRRPVYLPDVRGIAERVVKNDQRVLLVIDRVEEVAEPVAETMRRLGVRSLREAIGEPDHIVGHGNIRDATDRLLERLEALRSPKFRRTLLKRLDELGIESELVWRDWYDRISRISAIRFAQDVEARYVFRRRHYRTPVNAGFDPMSGAFWIKEVQQGALSSFYEAIAAQLVFKPTARPVHLLALERAMELEIRDPSFGRPESSAAYMKEEEDIEDEQEREGDGEGTETGEAIFGHSPFKPDPSRNVPKPGPIPSSLSTVSGRRGGRPTGGAQHKAEGDDRQTPELETEHIKGLKTEHYASHCQICLCERPPAELAPTGSYVEWEEVRRRVVEAHHVDPKSGGGARHAGNLILLCKLHHDNYGRRLTREAVTMALRETTSEKIVRFGSDGPDLSEVSGRVVDVVIPDTGEVLSIFFTNEHAGYWLSRVGASKES